MNVGLNSLCVNIAQKLSFSTFTQPLRIQLSPVLLAEPMKKKKKADPAIMKMRLDRKRKRLWRDIKRLMKHQKQLKPLDEMEIPYSIVDEPLKYAREKPALSAETLETRADLLQQWTAFKTIQHRKDLFTVDKLEYSRRRALEQLMRTSLFLYEEAVKIDETFLPFVADGPTRTPPIKDYDSPDGEYIDVTRKWDPPKIPEMDKRMKAEKAKKITAAYKERKEKNV